MNGLIYWAKNRSVMGSASGYISHLDGPVVCSSLLNIESVSQLMGSGEKLMKINE